MPTDRAQDTEAIRAAWQGPWKIEGPWHHDSGYPQTWTVSNAHRTLCDCPTEKGAGMVRDALDENARLVARLEAAERALRYIAGYDVAGYDAHLRNEDVARAALAAAAPGETTETE